MLANLALRIYRTSENITDVSSPFVSVGEFPEFFKPRLPKLVKDKESWLVIHASECIQYSYHVKSDGSITSVYLLVPATKKLSLKDSAYDILSQAYKMVNTSDSSSDTADFENILSKCTLEDDDQLEVPFMAGREPASFKADSKAQIAALLRFSKYKVLASVCQLEIGFDCKTTVALPIKSKAKRDSDKPSRPAAKTNTETAYKSASQPHKSESPVVDSDDDEEGSSKKGVIISVIVAACIIIGFIFYKVGNDSTPSLAKNDNIEAADKDKSDATKAIGLNRAAESLENNGRAHILNLANESKIAEIREYLKHDKCLSKAEVNAIEVVFGSFNVVFPQSSAAMKTKLKQKVEDSKPFKSIDDIVQLRQDLINMAVGR